MARVHVAHWVQVGGKLISHLQFRAAWGQPTGNQLAPLIDAFEPSLILQDANVDERIAVHHQRTATATKARVPVSRALVNPTSSSV